MQFLADILPAQIERPASVETTAWGAAYAAGLTRGLCPKPEAMMARWTAERRFTPAMPDGEREERYAGWQRAITGVLAMAGSLTRFAICPMPARQRSPRRWVPAPG